MQHRNKHQIREAVRKQYSRVARAQSQGCATGCCTSADTESAVTASSLGYSDDEIEAVPAGSNMGLGCGNPKAIAQLKPGETVLDLGSGGGFDSFLAAREVTTSGRVIGVDMTPAMLNKARESAQKAGLPQVEFRLGEIENLPVADNSVDVIISNCVINLSPDKARVFAESLRVLKPGGRLAISDVVVDAKLPEQLQDDMAAYTACMAGAAYVGDIESMLKKVGFVDIRISPKDESREFVRRWLPGSSVSDYLLSAFIEAVKPG